MGTPVPIGQVRPAKLLGRCNSNPAIRTAGLIGNGVPSLETVSSTYCPLSFCRYFSAFAWSPIA